MNRIIVFGVRSDYTETAYSNLSNCPGYKYYKSIFFRKYISVCERYGLTVQPFILKLLFFFFLLRYRKKDTLTFIYHGVDNTNLIKYGFCSFCKKSKRDTYHVGVYWDVFDFEKKVNIPLVKDELDDVVVIDEKLSKKYGVTYYPLFYSKKYNFDTTNNSKVFFCGEDGGRLKKLKEIAAYLKKYNVDYSFYCSNSNEERNDEYGIHYIKRMDHSVYVDELSKCSVLLDITKPGASCCSLRFCEAVLYDKKLLSDNVNIMAHSAYDDRYMKWFGSIEKIDLDFVMSNDTVNYISKKLVLPDGFIEYIVDRRNKIR